MAIPFFMLCALVKAIVQYKFYLLCSFRALTE